FRRRFRGARRFHPTLSDSPVFPDTDGLNSGPLYESRSERVVYMLSSAIMEFGFADIHVLVSGALAYITELFV
ncbi:unnamed protein product, partial [Rhizoctonia solani]